MIERSELKRFLVAMMADNPDIDLDEAALDAIVDEVSTHVCLCVRVCVGGGG